MWLAATNKTVQYAEDIHSITPSKDERSISLLCPTRHIRSRGDTLNLATMSIDISAEFDGVISVEVTHFRGSCRKGPDFELFPDGKPEGSSSFETSETGTTLVSGNLGVTVGPKKEDFEIKFHEVGGKGKELTSLRNRSVGFAYSPALTSPKQIESMSSDGVKHYIFTQTELGVGESIHGLGERFGAWNKVGQSVELWNEDGGTSSEQAYKVRYSSAIGGLACSLPTRTSAFGSAIEATASSLIHRTRSSSRLGASVPVEFRLQSKGTGSNGTSSMDLRLRKY